MPKNVDRLINDMNLLLESSPSLTLESFMLPEEEDYDMPPQERMPQQQPLPMDDEPQLDMGEVSGDVSGELSQIRQIAIQALARLADNPQSEGYNIMKKIWGMCDKAVEQNKPTTPTTPEF